MSLDAKIFAYCERGLDPAFLAEPVNALSNGAFVLAGLAAFSGAMRTSLPGKWLLPTLLSALLVLIGLGSFLFHTFATPWAAIADVAPIGVFMITYFACALRVFLRLPATATLLLTLGFAVTLPFARFIRCDVEGVILSAGVGRPCLNGSIGYLPALIAVITIGALLWSRRHRAGGVLLAAGGIFAVSLTFRTLDPVICPEAIIAGYEVGTHFLWHLLNALVLYLLVRTTLWSSPTESRAAPDMARVGDTMRERG